jgi:hypothetical protein
MSTTLTAENVRDIIEEGHILTPAGHPLSGSVPCDIRDEMRRAPEDFVGAELWQFPSGAEQGTAVRCTSGRGAMHWGGDSTWGDWSGDVFQADDADRQRFGADGIEITAEDAAGGDATLAAALRAIYGDTPLRRLATAVLPRVAASIVESPAATAHGGLVTLPTLDFFAVVDEVSRDPWLVTDDTPVAVRMIHRPDSERERGPFDGRYALAESGWGPQRLAELLRDAEERAAAREPLRAFVYACDGERWWEVDVARTQAERDACARLAA